MEFLRDIVDLGNMFFRVYILCYAVFMFLSALAGSLEMEERYRLDRYRSRLELGSALNYMPISIIVPAYNESVTIVDTVKSLRKQDYAEFEIVVVDYGSSDDTSRLLVEEFNLQRVDRPIRRQLPSKDVSGIWESRDGGARITLIYKVNGGKADALNMGINASRYPYFVCIDADSVLQRDALRKMIAPVLEDESVIACGGIVQVANTAVIVDGEVKSYSYPKKFLVVMQLLEYCRTFLGARLLLNLFNGNLIISGACGLYKKDIVVMAGGYDADTIGEDMELVVRLHAYCRSHGIKYKMVYAPDVVCWSQCPERLRDLRAQRRRWQMGLLQSIGKHRHILFNVRYGLVGTLSMGYYLLMEAFGPFIELFGLIFILLAAYLEMLYVNFMIQYFLLFIAFSALITLTTFFSRMYAQPVRLTFGQVLTTVLMSFVECFGFRQLITWYRISAFFRYRKSKNVWGKFDRTEHQRKDAAS